MVEEKTKVSGNIEANLYDLNRSLISQWPILDTLTALETMIDKFYSETNNSFYMLYGKEKSYFTLFHFEEKSEFSKLGDGVITCLKEAFDGIVAYEKVEGAIEIWVKDKDEATVFYLFPYDTGIVGVTK